MLLTAILFPVFGRARENAWRNSCLSNMKQLGLGMMQYMQDYDEIYPMHVSLPPSGDNKAWPQMIDPYTKSTQLFGCPNRTDFVYDGNPRFGRQRQAQ